MKRKIKREAEELSRVGRARIGRPAGVEQDRVVARGESRPVVSFRLIPEEYGEISVKTIRTESVNLKIVFLPLLVEGEPEEDARLLDETISVCVATVAEVHGQIEQNRGEIERLGAETCELLARLRAA